MTNTAKAEAIRKAWGVHYAEDIDENGWRESNMGSLGWDKEYFDIIKKDENFYLIRPKMLNGIVTNNGWIRIENEEDLPKEYGYYHFIWLDAQNNDRNEIYKVDNKGINCPPSACITHYQPIVKPEKPIY